MAGLPASDFACGNVTDSAVTDLRRDIAECIVGQPLLIEPVRVPRGEPLPVARAHATLHPATS